MTATGWPLVDRALACVFGLGLALTTVGGGEALANVAHELPPPRVEGLRRTGLFTLLFALFVTTIGTVLFVLLVPAGEQGAWVNAPLAGLAQHLAAPSWARDLVALALVAAALLMLVPAAHAALGDAERILRRLSAAGTLPDGLTSLHKRFGTPARAIDLSVVAAILVILVSGGRVSWLSRASAVAIMATVGLKIGSLLRLRRARAGALSFKVPLNRHLAGHDLPIGLLGPGVVLAACALVMVASGDAPSIATMAVLGSLSLLFVMARGRAAAPREAADASDAFDLLPSAELSLDQMDARPGNALVTVRNPHSLGHVVGALQAPGDRDIVVMTVRLGTDVAADASSDTATYARRAAAAVGGRGRRRSASSVRTPAHRPRTQRLRRHRGDGPAPPLVRRVRRRIGDPLRRRTGAPLGRCLGARRTA